MVSSCSNYYESAIKLSIEREKVILSESKSSIQRAKTEKCYEKCGINKLQEREVELNH